MCWEGVVESCVEMRCVGGSSFRRRDLGKGADSGDLIVEQGRLLVVLYLFFVGEAETDDWDFAFFLAFSALFRPTRFPFFEIFPSSSSSLALFKDRGSTWDVLLPLLHEKRQGDVHQEQQKCCCCLCWLSYSSWDFFSLICCC